MCTDTPSSHVVISLPRSNGSPCAVAACWALSHPAVVSWSVTATPTRPRSFASASISAGVRVPSENTVWQ